jgi:hypothetical protein
MTAWLSLTWIKSGLIQNPADSFGMVLPLWARRVRKYSIRPAEPVYAVFRLRARNSKPGSEGAVTLTVCFGPFSNRIVYAALAIGPCYRTYGYAVKWLLGGDGRCTTREEMALIEVPIGSRSSSCPTIGPATTAPVPTGSPGKTAACRRWDWSRCTAR